MRHKRTFRLPDGSETTDLIGCCDAWNNLADKVLPILPDGYKLTAFNPFLRFHNEEGNMLEFSPKQALEMIKRHV